MWKRKIQIGCAVFVLLVIISYCGVANYITTQYSSYDYMRRLAGVPKLGTLDETRAAILQQLPIGTAKSAVIAYIEAQNIQVDTFEGGQLMRYQMKDDEGKILVLLSEPPFPWRIDIACSQFSYMIHFNFDQQETLEEVAININAVCL